MSFGNSGSVRFDTSNAGGKPAIFWDQQSKQKKTKKKFGYKDKGLKIPLRNLQEPEEPEPKPKRPPVGSENKINRNIAAVGNKNSKQNNAKKGRPDGKKKPQSDMVTLTQGQFDKILETIGELTLLTEDKENNGTAGNPTYLSTDFNTNEPKVQLTTDIVETKPTVNGPSPLASPLPLTPGQHQRQSINPQQATTDIPKLDVTSPRYYDPRSVPDGPVTGNTRSSTLGVPMAHLTKAERKRLEWERQKVEEEEIQQRIQHTQKLHGTTGPNPQQPHPSQTSHPTLFTQTISNDNKHSNLVNHSSTIVTNEPTGVPGLATRHTVQHPASYNPPVLESTPQVVPGLSNIPTNVPTIAAPASQPISHVIQPPSAANTVPQPQHQTPQLIPSKPPLSKAEQKRLKWEREKAELAKVTEWDPWGKPGAGAPVKGTDGQILTDYNTRRSVESPREANNLHNYHPSEIIRQSFENPPQQHQQYHQQPQQQQAPPVATAAVPSNQASYYQQPTAPPAQVAVQQPQQTTNYTVPAPQPVTMAGQAEPPPAAIRSSFNIGAIAPDENKYQSAKERQRRQWVADLEKQREEDRLRKQQQQQKDLDLDRKDAMMNNYRPGGLVEQVTQQMTTQQQQQPLPPQQQQQQYTSNVQQVPVQYAQTQPQQEAGLVLPSQIDGQQGQGVPDTFIRGQNAYIDPLTKKELEDKRQKQLEYQEYIKQQMEQKENHKKAEREKKWREEIEEEKKLQRERDHIQAQLDNEQGKVKQKQQNEKKRLDALKSAIDEEKERAEWEKHEKRMMKLRKGGHDVSSYHSTFQSKHTPRDGAASVITVAPSYIPGLGQVGANVGTSSVHQSRDNAPSEQTSYPSPLPLPIDASNEGRIYHHDPYTENRVLTPSLFRSGHTGVANSTGREFGVQADLLGESLSRESTDIEFKGPIKKKVRVKSAAELKAMKLAKEKKTGFSSTYSKSAEPPKSAPVKTAAAGKPNLKPILKNKKTVPINKRPAWGQSNSTHQNKVVKQSEKDPYYEIKKQRSESSKVLRQQMLLEIADQGAPKVSQKSTVATRARSRSRGPDEWEESDLEQFTKPGSFHVATTNVKTGEKFRVNSRSRSRSPGYKIAPSQNNNPQQDTSRGHRSRVDYSAWSRTSNRNSSPPVPALKHKISGSTTPSHGGRNSPSVSGVKHKTDTDYNVDAYNYDSFRGGGGLDVNRNKYTDFDVVGAPVQNGQFVPFIRSTNVLDPSHAEDPLPMSREPSTIHKARQAYVQEHEPAKYGTIMDNFNDSRIIGTVPQQAAYNYNKDPLTNPSVVMDHPSQRQNKILQQLSDLRKGLRQKQMELEVGLQPEEVMG